MIDKSKAEGKGEAYSRWIDKENFKCITEIYAELGSLGLQSKEALESKISELHEQVNHNKNTIKEMNQELRTFNQILTFARQYIETKKYNDAYGSSKDQDRYFRTHSYELNLYWSACEHLKELGVDVSTIRLKDIEEHIQKLTVDKAQLVSSYRAKDRECKKLRQMDESLTRYLNGSSSYTP